MILIALSLFLSSFLLFLIQPLIGKYILPWFGSSPAVWSASLVFFQVLLTGGYAYAYALAGSSKPRRQALVHWLCLGGSGLAVLLGMLAWGAPLLPGAAWRPHQVDQPFWDVLKVLLVGVGAPYFLLASNSTLLQAWFSVLYPGRSPYRLYALSNLASLLGLLCYPFLIEPWLPVRMQARGWALGFGVYLVSAGLLAWRFWRAAPPALTPNPSPAGRGENTALEPGASSVGRGEDVTLGPHLSQRLLWLALPAVASLLLLAVTNQITQEVAVIPFLWVLPLALYLLSFILCFESDRWYGRGRFTLALLLTSAAYGLTLSKGVLVDIRIQVTAHCLLLFVCCMICHGELARLRPAPRHLTSFYLTVSVGGALGGLFVNLAAPLLFTYYWELALGWVLCLALYLLLTLFHHPVGAGLRPAPTQPAPTQPAPTGRAGTALMALCQAAALIILIWQVVENVQNAKANSLWLGRNFYGVLRVQQTYVGDQNDPAYELVHGITLHGMQFAKAPLSRLPTSYYWEGSGVGLALAHYPRRAGGIRVGVLGLGVGTLAAYGRTGDVFRFYEINPFVSRLAEGEYAFFSYLDDSPAAIEIVMGDARLSLERELEQSGSQGFDILVLDTFSSDAIPVHLITQQAFALYLQHLKPGGILAVHVSNRILDIEKVVYRLAVEFDLPVVTILTSGDAPGANTSRWELLTTNRAFLEHIAIRDYVVTLDKAGQTIQLWTDDYSNLLQILR